MKSARVTSIGLLTPEQKRKAIDRLIAYFADERGEEIGVIAAEELLDEVLDSAGQTIRDTAISDSAKVVQDHMADIELDLKLLQSK